MSIVLNNVNIAGNNVREIEVRETKNGTKATSGTLAVQRSYNKETKETITDFIRYEAYGPTAEFLGRHVQKGTPICISGSIRVKTVGEGDERREYTSVIVDNVSVDFSKAKAPGDVPAGDAQMPMPSEDTFEDIPEDSGLPFNL